jgi:prepilin-type processing-associated H-X9-DG protein
VSDENESRRKAFTLVEVLVVMGICLILGVLLVPAAAGLRSFADNASCTSNLRQIGAGVLFYAQDNDGRLPGPLLSGQYPFVNSLPAYARYSQLANVLKDYLDGQRVENESPRGTVFLCPAFKRAVPDYQYSVVYGVNIQKTLDGAPEPRQLFGYANNLDPETFGSMENLAPMRLADLGRLTDEDGKPAAASTWLLSDADALDKRFEGLKAVEGDSGWQRPVHGRRRNALFADFHVAPMPISK